MRIEQKSELSLKKNPYKSFILYSKRTFWLLSLVQWLLSKSNEQFSMLELSFSLTSGQQRAFVSIGSDRYVVVALAISVLFYTYKITILTNVIIKYSQKFNVLILMITEICILIFTL